MKSTKFWENLSILYKITNYENVENFVNLQNILKGCLSVGFKF